MVFLALAPLASLAWTALEGGSGHWQHLLEHVLPEAAHNTGLLLLGVGGISLFLGTGCAWMVTAYNFPGRGVLAWALLLPLAIPSYIIAFAYTDLLHPIGPVQTTLRALLGYESPRQWRLPDIRSLSGAIVLLGLVLYPYVYLSARAAFLTQSRQLMEAARMLGHGSWAVFGRVVLPACRPAYLTAAVMGFAHTLGEFGVVLMVGGNIAGQTRVISVQLFDHVESLEYAQAHTLAAGMLVFSFAVLCLLQALQARQHRG